mmetsp:Transcript_10015/g.28848  ORF Transcript_10015/g.28848 Transcript_10015/m.28848 type:complete len:354 (+) Transcript_10015:838-1899(+)
MMIVRLSLDNRSLLLILLSLLLLLLSLLYAVVDIDIIVFVASPTRKQHTGIPNGVCVVYTVMRGCAMCNFFSDSLIPPSFSFIVHLLKHSLGFIFFLHSIEFKIILFAAPTSELFFVLDKYLLKQFSLSPAIIISSGNFTSSTSFLNFFAFSSYPLTTSRDRRQMSIVRLAFLCFCFDHTPMFFPSNAFATNERISDSSSAFISNFLCLYNTHGMLSCTFRNTYQNFIACNTTNTLTFDIRVFDFDSICSPPFLRSFPMTAIGSKIAQKVIHASLAWSSGTPRIVASGNGLNSFATNTASEKNNHARATNAVFIIVRLRLRRRLLLRCLCGFSFSLARTSWVCFCLKVFWGRF